MPKLCLYFQVHQPYRVSQYRVFDIGSKRSYFEGPEAALNQAIFEKVASKCYLSTNALLLEMLDAHPEFHVSFSITGVFIQQCKAFGSVGKKVLDSFKKLATTGRVEFLAETYYHSLSSIYATSEFIDQVSEHRRLIEKTFGQKPAVFRNTELIYNNEIGRTVRDMGFSGILLEGWDAVLQGRSANVVYRLPGEEALSDKQLAASGDTDNPLFAKEGGGDFSLQGDENKKKSSRSKPPAVRSATPFSKGGYVPSQSPTASSQPPFGLLTKNYKLSDDIAFRFSDKKWVEHPLSTEKFVDWAEKSGGETVNLFMDYETFGEHQWEDSGIFDFLRHLPIACAERGVGFHTPSQAIASSHSAEKLDVLSTISWADSERDLSAWVENELQQSSLTRIFALEEKVKAAKNKKLLDTWRKLQTSDHFYYMSTKYWSDGDVHAYFSPFSSPYDAYIAYNNILTDLEERLMGSQKI